MRKIFEFLISFPNRTLNLKTKHSGKALLLSNGEIFLANYSNKQYFLFKFHGFKDEILMIKKKHKILQEYNLKNFMWGPK